MTDLKFKILECLYQSTRREIDHADIYNLNLAPIMETKTAIDDLISAEMLKYVLVSSSKLRITNLGIDTFEKLLQEREEKEQKEIHRKEQFRHNWKITFFNSIAGGIMGLITSILFWLITK